MFHAEWKFGMADFEKIRAIRTQVNVEGRGIPQDAEFDAFDGYAAHMLVLDDVTGETICTARLYPDGGFTRVDRFTVAPERAKEPFGEFLLRLALYKAQTLNTDIAVDATPDIAPLCPRFGMTAAQGAARGEARFTCPADGVKWFSACGDLK